MRSKSSMYPFRTSKSTRAGLVLPVTRFSRKLKAHPQAPKRVAPGAGVYCAAVLEYLIAEVCELSGNAARDNRKKRITPRHIMLAISCDEELNRLLKNVVIPGAGVLPCIQSQLMTSTSTQVAASKVKKKYANKPVNHFVGGFKSFGTGGDSSMPTTSGPLAGFLPFASPNAGTNVGLTVLNTKFINVGSPSAKRSIQISVVKGDITNVKVDAIVHPTSSSMGLGGQVGNAISRKGGPAMHQLVTQLHSQSGNLANCSVAICDASPSMWCKRVIHVNSPSFNQSSTPQSVSQLTKAVNNILKFANQATESIKTLAMPSISSGGNGFPKQLAAETILRTINGFFRGLSEDEVGEGEEKTKKKETEVNGDYINKHKN